MSTVPLPSGASMPLLGFGTWRLRGDEAVDATATALRAGYRHLDTATMYGNEREVGRALHNSDVERADVFVTTKVPQDHTGRARQTLESSLDQLGLEQLDLWLVHWPPDDSVAMWREVVQAQADGLVRDIGVSNYSPAQLDELTEATGVTPAVNQVPWSPLRFDADLLAAHRERGVVLEGYSGLRHGVLDLPAVLAVADRAGRTPAQVVIRWHLQHGVGVIPKSANPERIAANADVDFVLSDEDVAALDGAG